MRCIAGYGVIWSEAWDGEMSVAEENGASNHVVTNVFGDACM
jgi:hypothetical protein